MPATWHRCTRTVFGICLAALAVAAGCDREPSPAPPSESPPPPAPVVTEIRFGPADKSVTMFGPDGKPADLRSDVGKGVGGAGDFAFDNTAASGMGGIGGHARGPRLLPGKDARFGSFTIQGWFRAPPGRTIGGGAVLVSHRAGHGGFELHAKTNGTLTLWFGDGTTGHRVISPQVYTESGQWVFFAVTFAAATKADPEKGIAAEVGCVTFYKGTARTAVREVDRAETSAWPPASGAGLGPLAIGARADGSRAFQGRLDNIRIHTAPPALPPGRRHAGIVNLPALEITRRRDLGHRAANAP